MNHIRNTLEKAKTTNKLNPNMAPGQRRTGPHWWMALSGLTAAPSLLPKYTIKKAETIMRKLPLSTSQEQKNK